MRTTTTHLGELIAVLYDEFMAVYHDEELASLATAATINDLLNESAMDSRGHPSLELTEREEAAA